MRERVFDKFFRVADEEAAGPNRPRGAGMGLAIARGIVEAHAGHIFIEAGAGGRGTRVTFTVPVGDEEETSAESKPQATPAFSPTSEVS